MLILVDTGSSHSFVSSQSLQLTKLSTSPIPTQKVKLANGQWMNTNRQVKNLPWYIQGHSFSTDMIVLDMLPYDAILGYDWLKQYNPMSCDWAAKTLQFKYHDKQILLKGLQAPDLQLSHISAKQVYKSSKGNDVWAFVLLNKIQHAPDHPPEHSAYTDNLQLLLTQYADVFQDPK